MPKRFFSLVILLLLIAGCRQSAQPTVTNAPSLNIQLTVDPAKPVVGKVTLTVTLTDAAGKPVDGATVAVKGDMRHAGMQPVVGETQTSTNGEYRIPLEWTMGGEWFVEVTATLPDGKTARQTFQFMVGVQ